MKKKLRYYQLFLKLKEFIASTYSLKEILKGVLQAQMKELETKSQSYVKKLKGLIKVTTKVYIKTV